MPTYLELLIQWLEHVGGTSSTGDAQWNILYDIAFAYGASPAPGDTIADLWERIRMEVAGGGCHCGDNDWQSARRILEALAPGDFSQGDALYDILSKIVDSFGP